MITHNYYDAKPKEVVLGVYPTNYTIFKPIMENIDKVNNMIAEAFPTGIIYVEYGQPYYIGSRDTEEWFKRIETIDYDNVCAKITNIKAEYQDGNIVITGVIQEGLIQIYKNPIFALRSLVDRKEVEGKMVSFISKIITWDFIGCKK